MEIELNVQNRVQVVDLLVDSKKVSIKVSRADCKDVLLEVIDSDGKAKGKPLNKCLPEITAKSISKLRFMMNDFSTRPIKITLEVK